MITAEKLTPMLRMTDAEIDGMLYVGLYGRDKTALRLKRERDKRREECQYDRYVDDWEREGDE